MSRPASQSSNLLLLSRPFFRAFRLELDELAEARRAFEQASEFRRRRYLAEDGEALRALAQIYEREGRIEKARETYRRMAELPLLSEFAAENLERLAG